MVVLIMQKGTILKQRESKELAKLKQANGWIKTPKLQCCVLPFPTLGEEIRSVMLKDRASLVAQTAKNLPAVQEIQVQSEQDRSPGEGNGYPVSILAWRIPQTEEPGRLQSMGLQS